MKEIIHERIDIEYIHKDGYSKAPTPWMVCRDCHWSSGFKEIMPYGKVDGDFSEMVSKKMKEHNNKINQTLTKAILNIQTNSKITYLPTNDLWEITYQVEGGEVIKDYFGISLGTKEKIEKIWRDIAEKIIAKK